LETIKEKPQIKITSKELFKRKIKKEYVDRQEKEKGKDPRKVVTKNYL
jgi:hypothetical protein